MKNFPIFIVIILVILLNINADEFSKTVKNNHNTIKKDIIKKQQEYINNPKFDFDLIIDGKAKFLPSGPNPHLGITKTFGFDYSILKNKLDLLKLESTTMNVGFGYLDKSINFTNYSFKNEKNEEVNNTCITVSNEEYYGKACIERNTKKGSIISKNIICLGTKLSAQFGNTGISAQGGICVKNKTIIVESKQVTQHNQKINQERAQKIKTKREINFKRAQKKLLDRIKKYNNKIDIEKLKEQKRFQKLKKQIEQKNIQYQKRINANKQLFKDGQKKLLHRINNYYQNKQKEKYKHLNKQYPTHFKLKNHIEIILNKGFEREKNMFEKREAAKRKNIEKNFLKPNESTHTQIIQNRGFERERDMFERRETAEKKKLEKNFLKPNESTHTQMIQNRGFERERDMFEKRENQNNINNIFLIYCFTIVINAPNI